MADTRLQTPGGPLAAGDADGVMIEHRSDLPSSGGGLVTGTFRLPRTEALAIDPHPHKGLVLLARCGSRYRSVTPFHGQIMFPDDVVVDGEQLQGSFSFDLWAETGLNEPGRYYVMVSLGVHQSNLLEFVLEPAGV